MTKSNRFFFNFEQKDYVQINILKSINGIGVSTFNGCTLGGFTRIILENNVRENIG